jgi:molybdate transport system ATP-binding protein
VNRFALQADYAGFTLDADAEWSTETCALFGASGSGKSTILEAMAGLRPEVRGEVVLGGRALGGLRARERGIGWVPQDAALFPHMTVAENLEFAAARHGDAQAADAAVAALEIAPLLARRGSDLSGGERQRVAIARALAARPSFLLLDEPLASVDRPLRARIVPYLQRIPIELGVPMLVVTHDPLEVLALARHVLVLEKGRVAATGDPRTILIGARDFGGLSALTAENHFHVASAVSRNAMLWLRTSGGLELVATAVPGFPEPRLVAIRAEDVLVATVVPTGISAQNVIAGRVVALDAADGQVLLSASCGDEVMHARITRRAAEGLGVAVGQEVFLIVKAHAVLIAG